MKITEIHSKIILQKHNFKQNKIWTYIIIGLNNLLVVIISSYANVVTELKN